MAPDTFAQQIPLIQYKQEQGLPSNIIYSVIRDRKGYLWIGTDKGLCLFNGYTFKTYTTLDGLPDNEVFSCTEDLYGRLWLVTFKGDLCFLKDNVFHTAANTPWLKLPPSSDLFFSPMVEESDSSFNIVSNTGTSFVHIKGNQLKLINLHKIIYGGGARRSGTCVVKRINANRFLLYADTFRIIVDSSFNLIEKKNVAYNIGYSHDRTYLINKKGIWDLDENLVIPAFNVAYDKYNSVHPLLLLDKKRFWLGTKTNLFLNNQRIFNEKSKPVTSIEKDIAGDYWVSTRGDGLYRISRYFDSIQITANAYSDRVIYARKVKGIVYFITGSGGIYKSTSGKTEKIKELFKGRQVTLAKEGFYISDQGVLLLIDKLYRNYWIPDITKPRLRVYPLFFRTPQEEPGVKAIIPYGKYLYEFSPQDVIRIKKPGPSLTSNMLSTEFLLDGKKTDAKRIYAKAIDQQTGDIWYSRQDGIHKMTDGVPRLQKQLSPFVFRQFDFYGPYLVGITDNSKLIIINSADKHLKWDSTRNDICIWEDICPIDRQHAIISTNNDYRLLTLYPPHSSGMPRYTLQAIENHFIPQKVEYVFSDTQNCYFFKEGTITKVSTSALFAIPPPPIPVFSSFKATGKSYPLRPRITIPYSESKNINLVFDNIAFNGNDITCEYSILKEGKEDWLAITGNEINLNTPGFGDYTIKIRSKTISSNYSRPAIIHLTILKPFWATWWFITLAILLLIALVWAIVLIAIWYRLRKKQKEHDADMKYQQSEYKALNALMNPHFIFNSLNNIQGLINKDEKRVANEYLVIFSDLVRQNMNNISKGFITLQQELNLVENYLTLEKLRFKDLVNYEIQVAEDVETEDIMIPPLMIQPLVENAVKHGLLPKQSTENMVRIHVFERDDLLHVEITDNGIGLSQSLRSKNRLYDSMGLTNLKKRTEHLKKIQQQEIDIEITELENEHGVTGTRASIKMSLPDY